MVLKKKSRLKSHIRRGQSHLSRQARSARAKKREKKIPATRDVAESEKESKIEMRLGLISFPPCSVSHQPDQAPAERWASAGSTRI